MREGNQDRNKTLDPIGASDRADTAAGGSPADAGALLSKEPYVSPEYVQLERRFLWPKVWQVVGRVEEIPQPGDFITYEICDESVIVIRAEDGGIRAFNNACTHRGRRLTSGCGHAQKLFCRFHGWRWNLNGQIEEIPDREDWRGALADADVALPEFKTGTWGGFVFITFDPNAEPLLDYLAPIPQYLDWGHRCRLRALARPGRPLEAQA